jgi:hypothetical protein
MTRPRKRQSPTPPTAESQPGLEFVGSLPIARLVGPLARLLTELDKAMLAEEREMKDPPRAPSAERRTACPWALVQKASMKAAARMLARWLRAQRRTAG